MMCHFKCKKVLCQAVSRPSLEPSNHLPPLRHSRVRVNFKVFQGFFFTFVVSWANFGSASYLVRLVYLRGELLALIRSVSKKNFIRSLAILKPSTIFLTVLWPPKIVTGHWTKWASQTKKNRYHFLKID